MARKEFHSPHQILNLQLFDNRALIKKNGCRWAHAAKVDIHTYEAAHLLKNYAVRDVGR